MGSNYQPQQQRRYFIKGNPDAIGQQQQAPQQQQQQQQQQHRHSTTTTTTATTMTMTAAANGLPRVPSSSTKTAFDQYSLARLHQHQYANISINNNNHQQQQTPQQTQQQQQTQQRASPPTARQLRHLYEPLDSMAALRAADQIGAGAQRARASDQVHHSDSHYQQQQQQQQQQQFELRAQHSNTTSDCKNHNSYLHHGHRKHELTPGANCAHLEQQRRNMTSECCRSAETTRSNQADLFDQLEPEADQYANQLRRSQILQQHQQHRARAEAPAGFHVGANKQQTQVGQLQQPRQQTEHKTTAAGGSGKGGQQHVNFNRSSQAQGGKDTDDDETGESGRKKKYLTAKYGQQQMNLIKKRLKIEMWLHDQLQELAKASKVVDPDELDEIDIDLDLLLDMEDDLSRRRSLKKTLEPLSDLPGESLERFIDEVLEQSKLL